MITYLFLNREFITEVARFKNSNFNYLVFTTDYDITFRSKIFYPSVVFTEKK